MVPPRRPVWHRGEVKGFVEDRTSSDKLLLRIAERLDPSWSPRSVVDQHVTLQGAVLAVRPEDILHLSPAEQDAFVAMLGKIADARGEDDDDVPRLLAGSDAGKAQAGP